MTTSKNKSKESRMTEIAAFIAGEGRRVSIDEIREKFHMLSVNTRSAAMYRLRCVPGLLEVTGSHPHKEYYCSPAVLESFINGQISGYATMDKRSSGKKRTYSKREIVQEDRRVKIVPSGDYAVHRLPNAATSVFDYARVVNL